MSQTASNNSGKGVSHLKHATTDFAPCIFENMASPSAQHARASLLIKTSSSLEIALKKKYFDHGSCAIICPFKKYICLLQKACIS